jgi:branched-chain amino acid transport system permease protein
VFQFSVLSGSTMVLMALLGGVRHLFGPLLGALVVGGGLEYATLAYGDTPLHLVVTGALLGGVVVFMPDGVVPALASLVRRLFGPREASIREVTAAELLERAAPDGPAAPEGNAEPPAAHDDTAEVGR